MTPTCSKCGHAMEEEAPRTLFAEFKGERGETDESTQSDTTPQTGPLSRHGHQRRTTVAAARAATSATAEEVAETGAANNGAKWSVSES
jgi:hypothetical protein